MTKEEKFYSALRDIFVGEEVEGESGYINLMKIKSRYFLNGILPILKKDVEEKLKPFPEFREELFDKLYTFFRRYFSKTGSIYFDYTPFQQSVYERVYTDDKDVILFWKTRPLYYVKTDRLFKSMEVEIEGFRFRFDVSRLQYKKALEKRELIYEFKFKEGDGTIVLTVSYSERGGKTKVEEILRSLRRNGVKISEEVLERAFRVFEKQSEVDYFINKNAKEFLQEQFKLWMFQYVFSGESEWTEKRVKQLQVLKDIAFKIIDFISQFEDELVKIWNKPRFVLNSNYVITLDRIANKNIGLVEKILNHPNFDQQVKEWKELGIVNGDFEKEEILKNTLVGWELNERYKFLPIDTKYFKDLELEILGLFEDLDRELDGWLIKSENYQALNTILPKFREKVQTIYIDPPFNKEQDADYFYTVKYKDAIWATMLENRLSLARDLLNERGSIFVRCDYNGNWIVRPLMNEIFGKENFRNEIVIAKTKEFFKTMTHIKKFAEESESLFFFSKTANLYFNLIYKDKDKPSKYEPFLPVEDKFYQDYREINGKKYYSPKGRKWGIKQEDIDEVLKKGRLVFENNRWYLLTFQEPLKNVWIDYQGYSRMWSFQTENSEILLKRVIESTSNEGDLVMDFFLGSGTTTAVAHKLKRKWIGVEMGEHFYTIVLPRMKKVLAYDKTGISKEKDVKEKYNEKNAGGFFKYYELEQYEDTLRRVKYEDADLFDNPYQDPYSQYIFMKDLKLLSALEIDYQNNKIKVDLPNLYPNIDIAETLSNLLGKWIKKITSDYLEFQDGERINLKELDYKLIKPLIWW